MSSPVLSDLPPAQSAAVERMSTLARSRGLRIAGRVEFPWPADLVESHDRPGVFYMVWEHEGRLLCSCPGRRNPSAFTCSHAQAVRLMLLAKRGAIQPASVPSYVEPSAPASPPEEPPPAIIPVCSWCRGRDVVLSRCEDRGCPYRLHQRLVAKGAADPDPDPEPDPDPAPSGPRCPSCGGEADQRELDELGECLRCVAGSAERRGEYVARCACGAVATGDTKDGPVCDACATRRQERIGQLLADAKKTATAGAIIQRERSRQRRYREQGREAAGDPRPAQAKEERKAKATATRERKQRRAEAKKREEAPLLRSNAPVDIWK